MSRIAVVLFNLGGPDSPAAVRPFLFNLFNDPAIIDVPGPLRWLLAQFISRRRAPIAQDIYAHLGGKSPLLDLTNDQAEALQRELGPDDEVKVFVCMRYWHPMSDAVTGDVNAFRPDQVILLPLYPQYSTTTVGSSLADWHRAAARADINAPTHEACCFPLNDGWLAAQTTLIGETMSKLKKDVQARVLFSAHGLPKKIIDAGDPYQWQVEQTAKAVATAAGLADWAVCYQSRVGRLEWIGPSTEDELARAGAAGVAVIVVPIAFVSEHSETLVELDIEYREEAEKLGVPAYYRVPAVGTHADFIKGLADKVRAMLKSPQGQPHGGNDGRKLCPPDWRRCPCQSDQAAG